MVRLDIKYTKKLSFLYDLKIILFTVPAIMGILLDTVLYRLKAEAKKTKVKKVLAITSGGGHWVQLLRITPAFNDCKIVYATVNADYQKDVFLHKFHKIKDANRKNPVGVIILALQALTVVLRERADIIISTGAAPGFFGLFFGKLLGAKTIWIDSIANAEEPSLSGRKVKPYADMYLTQWKHLAQPEGPYFKGAVI